MKLRKSIIFTLGLASLSLASCDDYLEQAPPSKLTPENFYNTEDQVQAAANRFYQDVLPSHGGGNDFYSKDNTTDVQTGRTPDNKFSKNLWKTGQTNGNWSWGNIRNINYILNRLLDNKAAGIIQGNQDNINEYIGEIYFFRAWAYFDLYQKFGDLPIVTQALPDNEAILVAANHREPRNEVARFIINNLDTAMTYMKDNFENRHTRLSKDAALLFKSRVALYEGSWLTNFAGTPFVPNGEGWPGKASNPDYQFPAGSLENEAKWFFQQAVESSEQVAEKYFNNLSVNNNVIPQKSGDTNPYFEIWGTTDCSDHPEVLLWREYSKALGITNGVEVAAEYANDGSGLTRGLVDGYVMKDGRPTYNSRYEYSDMTLDEAAQDRDPRISLFLKRPGQVNCYKNLDDASGSHYTPVEPIPAMITFRIQGLYQTGYTIRKGMTYDRANCGNFQCANACPVLRATEALLNYMEAEYMLTKNINAGNILKYWKKIRQCAGFDADAQDPMVTIDATDMSKETMTWDAYTAGQLLSDKVLYNIRRERRSELLAEGFRDMDLKRWRSYDQLVNNPVHLEGFHLWNTPMQDWYPDAVADGSANANMSSPKLSEWFRPHEIVMVNNNFTDGLTWHMAHYLQPLPLRQFLLTSSDHASVDKSTLYQNPYWPTTSDMPAEK